MMKENITEYDIRIPDKYKEKAFTRLDKSFMRAQPNHLGLEHIKEREVSLKDEIRSHREGGY